MAIKIFIDQGHNPQNPNAGAEANGIREQDINYAVGKELDGAGWVCLEDGTCTVEILTNLDDAPGAYRLVCRDRATGLTVERSIQKPTR